MTSMRNIFNFSRPLPEPFDGLANKKVKVSSKYGDGTEATLNCTMVKAINAVCRCMAGKGEGAVGVIDHRSIAEYKSSASPSAYHLAVYDSARGAALASVYDMDTERMGSYTMNTRNRDGAAVLMAMMPFLLKDIEFKEQFDTYYGQFQYGWPDREEAKKSMAILCDNAYRRLRDEKCPAHLKLDVDTAGNLMRVSRTQLDAGKFTPREVTAGEFRIFARTLRTRPAGTKKTIDQKDFEGKYALGERELTPQEEALVPRLPDWYVIPPEAVDICRHAKGSTGRPTQMRNFLLRGPAGTGKTMAAKAIAAGLRLPYLKYTCSAGTEIFDFIGMIMPDQEKDDGREGAPDAGTPRMPEKSSPMPYSEIAEIAGLPDAEDMEFDPPGSFEAMTGTKKPDATTGDCIAAAMEKAASMLPTQAPAQAREGDRHAGQTYSYVETDFIKALKNGYVLEIQEPTTIVQPGVLVGLNSLLEQAGTITLPTGERVTRHPDAVVIITTNTDYEGCRGMNQSVTDRMSLVKDMGLPDAGTMAQRAMGITGATDMLMVTQMVQVVSDMADYCRKNSITDGSCGMRSLIDWVLSTEITGDPYESALGTVISKATADPEDREALATTILEPVFPPKSLKAA